MHRPIIRLALVSLAFVATFASTTAIAASDKKVSATFETLAASGVSGQASLQSMAAEKGTQIHAQLRGLQPGIEYIAFIYKNSGCTSQTGDTGIEVVRFTANPAGLANFNSRVAPQLTDIGSVAIQLVSDPTTVQACAAVVQ